MIWMFFAIFLCACAAAGTTGGMFPPGQWYRDLQKPEWTPPDWLFPVAWSVLYLCMAWAAARVAVLPGSSLALALWALKEWPQHRDLNCTAKNGSAWTL